MKMVYVEWLDSCSLDGAVWFDHDDVKAMIPHKCVTIGFIRKETKKKFILVSSLADGLDSGIMCIPKGCITKIRRIK